MRGSVGVAGEEVVWIGSGGDAEPRAGRVLEANGRVLAPGFIDVHTHDDFAALLTPLLECKLLQGVTTEVVGNCGMAVAPGVILDTQDPTLIEENTALLAKPQGVRHSHPAG
jgi:N-acyl-D-aspartate/D-glutamate deacylase